jgi:hypothetical protein
MQKSVKKQHQKTQSLNWLFPTRGRVKIFNEKEQFHYKKIMK